MADKIEVYVKREKKLAGERFAAPMSDGVMRHSCLPHGAMLEYEKALPEADKRTLELVNEFAERKALQVEVFDISTFKGKLKATARRIEKTPTIVAGQERIEAESSPDILKEKLEAHFTKADA
jgi:hypothetical protein